MCHHVPDVTDVSHSFMYKKENTLTINLRPDAFFTLKILNFIFKLFLLKELFKLTRAIFFFFKSSITHAYKKKMK